MAARKKSTATSTPDEWKDFPHAAYEKAGADLVHHSFKTINSNIPPGGVRLTAAHALDLPYVSGRTLLAAGERLALDYVANAGQTATLVKQLHQVIEGATNVPDEEATRLRALLDRTMTTSHETGTDKVSIRARQVLLPRMDGSYIAFSPAPSGGVARRFREGWNAHEEARQKQTEKNTPQHVRIPRAVFGLGGSNPQNVGSLVRDMQRPLVFFPPRESRHLRHALSLHFRGLTLRLPHKDVCAFRDWHAACRTRHGGSIPTDMDTRDEEIVYVQRIAARVLCAGEEALAVLKQHIGDLPNGGIPLVAASVDPTIRGLIDPALRDREWPRALAEQLSRRLTDYQFRDDKGGFQFDQADLHKLQGMIEEMLR